MPSRDFSLWYKANYARLLAVLVKQLSDFALAEDVLSDACAALATAELADIGKPAPAHCMPDNRSAWVYRVAYNAGMDAKRRTSKFNAHVLPQHIAESEHDLLDKKTAELPYEDHRLALIFLCAHPALSADSQAMLMLRYALGLEVADIALWFGADPDAVRRRLHRARDKIQATRPRFELPELAQWQERLAPVLSTLEVLYDQSYSNVGGGPQADAFAREAEQLGLQLSAHLPHDTQVLGLAAMIVLAQARRPARLYADDTLIPLDQQDTARWDDARIALGSELLLRAAAVLRKTQTLAGGYVVRAMISAQHCTAKHTGTTPWKAIARLYAALLAIEPSVQAHVNYALSIEKLKGAQAALDYLQDLHDEKHLALFLARAHLLERLAHYAPALTNLNAALAMSMGKVERKFIENKRDVLIARLRLHSQDTRLQDKFST
jgi:RNA polymerase sigma-70 factor, ECF subfamily